MYFVFPSLIERIAASRNGSGVMKSGSPTPSEMAPSTPAMRSKNRRMPLAGIFDTRELVSGRIVFMPPPPV